MRISFLLFLVLFISGGMTLREYSAGTEIKTPTAKPKLQWLTLEEALAKNKKFPKKILIDVYTDWCGYCKKMDKQVYQNPAVVEKLNQNFYVVKLNAESRQPITINGTTYRYKPEYKAHELAVSLLQGEMSFPSTVFLNDQQQVMLRVAGYIPPKDFLKGLDFILAQK